MKTIYWRFLTLVLLSGCIWCAQASQQISEESEKGYISIVSLKSLYPMINNLNADSLVIFDLDDTLTCSDAFMFPRERAEYSELFNTLWGSCINEATPEQAQRKFEKLRLPLVQKTASEFISRVQSRQAKVIALTRGGKGKIASRDQPDYMRWRSCLLASLGIDLSKSFDFYNYQFTTLGTADDHPAFYNGILFAAPCLKGEVFKEFLKIVQWTPKKIIFIDNDRANVEDVDQAAKSLGIDSIGVVYLRAMVSSRLDVALLKTQVDYLVEHGQWPHDRAQSGL